MSNVQIEAAKPKKFYQCHLPYCNIVRPDGKFIHFQAGVFGAVDDKDIRFLDNEIANNHPFIYHDPKFVPAVNLTKAPREAIEEIENAAIARYIKQQEELGKATRDMGTTEKASNTGAGSTSTVAGNQTPITAATALKARMAASGVNIQPIPEAKTDEK